MYEITHRFIETNGIRMHIAECGSGPLVVLCHGFPESWFSWRHQLPALAAAGYHVVAPDQRGYGETDAPTAIDQYSQFHLSGDIVGLIRALGEQQAILVGHDWGSPVVWNTALLRPDLVRGVMSLSVPFQPRGSVKPTDGMRAMAGENFFYILYFQEPGVAEAELEADVRHSLRSFYYSASGDPAPSTVFRRMPKTAKFLEGVTDPGSEWDTWLSKPDLDYFVSEFSRTGFRGGLNWYRNVDRTWEYMAALHGAKVTVPAFFMAGSRDGVIAMNPQAVSDLKKNVPNLRGSIILDGVGHWTQQERPEEVNAAIVGFIKSLDFAEQ
ncbi:MAG: alpha/beta fold hydrolase [Dehalococcoidia bacterium]